MKKIFISTIFTLYLLFNAVPLKAQQRDSLLSAHIDSLLTKEKIKILITDSGLGGLSVAAEIEKIITNAHMFKEAEIIFVNALPDANFRYNSMPDESTKVKFFDKTLIGMEQWFHPDIIFIACNTLSVVYPESEYYKHGNIPVVGIVDLGVNLIQKKLTQYPDSKVIILGTETTISSNTHKNRLIVDGFNEERIFCQACPNLETEIQSHPKSELVKDMIDLYTDDVVPFVSNKNIKIFAALCCTHYPYVSDEFKSILSTKTGADIEILNPNKEMANLIKSKTGKKYDNCSLNVKVYSQAAFSAEETGSIAEILELTSVPVANALRNYIHKTDLFKLN